MQLILTIGKINIRELLMSPIYQEFYSLKENKDDSSNWFTINSAMTVYGIYNYLFSLFIL